jgi:hypothetical protein
VRDAVHEIERNILKACLPCSGNRFSDGGGVMGATKRGQLAVGFMCDDSFGVETAKLVQKLLTEEEFDVVPLNKGEVAAGYLRRVDAVLAPDVVGAKNTENGLYRANIEKTKEFLARGGRIFAWGKAAQTAKSQGVGVTCVANADEAIQSLRAFAAEPVSPDAYRKLVLKKVKNPIRAGIFQIAGHACRQLSK